MRRALRRPACGTGGAGGVPARAAGQGCDRLQGLAEFGLCTVCTAKVRTCDAWRSCALQHVGGSTPRAVVLHTEGRNTACPPQTVCALEASTCKRVPEELPRRRQGNPGRILSQRARLPGHGGSRSCPGRSAPLLGAGPAARRACSRPPAVHVLSNASAGLMGRARHEVAAATMRRQHACACR